MSSDPLAVYGFCLAKKLPLFGPKSPRLAPKWNLKPLSDRSSPSSHPSLLQHPRRTNLEPPNPRRTKLTPNHFKTPNSKRGSSSSRVGNEGISWDSGEEKKESPPSWELSMSLAGAGSLPRWPRTLKASACTESTRTA